MKFELLLIALLLPFSSLLCGQDAEGIPYVEIGRLQPRAASEIAANNWSVGAETMDRDIVDFSQIKDHIGLLGAKQVRLQGGWAKCEKVKGIYDFDWLDEVIDHLLAEGMEPWLQTSYGNPIYEGGGGVHLSAGFPTSEEALEAWDRWVAALAKRYRGRVRIWEIWNEPENGNNTAGEYARLYERTAEIIRAEIPDAEMYALSLGAVSNYEYVRTFVDYLDQRNKLHLVDDITVHGYTFNPSDVYEDYEEIQRIIHQYADHIRLRQGELGCPSERQPIYALRGYDWTELSQAKWALRKMLGDLGHDIPSSYFGVIDYVYTHDHEKLMETPKRNTKGLIKADLDKRFAGYKQSYHTYRNVTSVFDHTLERIPNYPYTVDADTSLAVYGYRQKSFDRQAVVIWFDAETPINVNDKIRMTFTFSAGHFDHPVYVDLRTGVVYEIPATDWKRAGSHYTFTKLPVYDAPILVADKSLLLLKE